MKIWRVGLLIGFLAAIVADAGWATCPPRVLTRLGTATAGDRSALVDYWKGVPAGSQTEHGLIVSLELAAELGPRQVAEIIRIFPSPSPHLERIARLEKVPGLKKEIAELGSGDPLRVKGAAGELRYADEVLPPSARAAEFQVAIPSGKVPDILDEAGGFHEVKYRDWTRLPPVDELWRGDLEGVVAQAESIRAWAVSRGGTCTLAFEVPVPATHRAMFDRFFDELRNRPGMIIIEGF